MTDREIQLEILNKVDDSTKNIIGNKYPSIIGIFSTQFKDPHIWNNIEALHEEKCFFLFNNEYHRNMLVPVLQSTTHFIGLTDHGRNFRDDLVAEMEKVRLQQERNESLRQQAENQQKTYSVIQETNSAIKEMHSAIEKTNSTLKERNRIAAEDIKIRKNIWSKMRKEITALIIAIFVRVLIKRWW